MKINFSKNFLFISIIIVAVLLVALFFIIQLSRPNGTTLAERESIIREQKNCKTMSISTEKILENYIICGIYDNNKSGIATFEMTRNGYKLQRITLKDKNSVIISTEYLDERWYQLIWFNGAETKFAELEIINTDNNEIVITESYDVSNGEIIAFCEPDNLVNFSLNVVYYDDNGKAYK